MKNLFLIIVGSLLFSQISYAGKSIKKVSPQKKTKNSKSKQIIRGRGGMPLSIGSEVLGIASEGKVIGINTTTKIIDVQIIDKNHKVTVEKIPSEELQVLRIAKIEYIDAGGIEKISKNAKVLSFLGEAKVIKVYENNLIRIKALNSEHKEEKVVNASDVDVLIPTKRGVKGMNGQYTIMKGNLVTFEGDADVLETYKYSKVKILCHSTNEIKIVASTDLSINNNIQIVNVRDEDDSIWLD